MKPLYMELRLRLLTTCMLSIFISSTSLLWLFFFKNVGFSFPWQWFIDTASELVSVANILVFTLNGCCLSLFATACSLQLSVSDYVVPKYHQLWTILIWRESHFIITTTTLSAVNGYIVLNVVSPPEYTSALSVSHGFSLNQKFHCLITFFAFIGFWFGAVLLVFNRRVLNFSQRTKSISDIVWEHLVRQCLSTVGRIVYFIPIYFIFSCPFSGYARHFSLFGVFFDLRMLFLMFVIGFHLQLSFNCTIDILKWQFMKNLQIPLVSPLQPEESVLDILKTSEDPLVKHLTLERLADLVASSPVARSDIFALKELGGNAPHWQEIYVLCITVLRRFISCTHWMNSFRLRKNTLDLAHLQSSGRMYELNLPNKLRKSTLVDIPRNTAHADSASISEATANQFWSRGLKASTRWPLLDVEIPLASTADLFTTGGAIVDQLPWAVSGGVAARRRLLGVNSGQAVIWATEILACLTLASYTEDAYGSVQRCLGQILSTFVEALQVVERQLQLVGLMRHSLRHVDDDLDDLNTNLQVTVDTDDMAVASGSACDLGATNESNRRPRTVPIDVHSGDYYRFASDPTLPWRLHATLAWAVSKCLTQFGAHLESMQLDRRSLEKLQSVKKNLFVIKNGVYNSAV